MLHGLESMLIMLLESANCVESELTLLCKLKSIEDGIALIPWSTTQEIVVASYRNLAASLVCDKESSKCRRKGGIKGAIAVYEHSLC